jgi:hypothetical protein
MSLASHHWRPRRRRRFGFTPRRWFRVRSWRIAALYVAFAAAGLGVLAWDLWPPARIKQPLFGEVVVDGDTLRQGAQSFRLHGIDAPEFHQICADGWRAGEAARRALQSLVNKGRVHCERLTTDRYGRTVAICRINGEDLGAAMVRRGMAWASYSQRYLIEEIRARYERLGVHARSCDSPQNWRAPHRR